MFSKNDINRIADRLSLDSLWIIFSAVICLEIWLILYSTTEWLITEHWFISNSVPNQLAATMLLAVMSVAAIFTYKARQYRKRFNGISIIIFTLLSVFFLVGIKTYQNYYSNLQRIPKIKSFSKDWSIQGDKIVIEGKNFGSAERAGTVHVNEIVFSVYSWSNTRVVVEQPITQQYQVGKLKITNYHGNSAYIEPFELKDPASVL